MGGVKISSVIQLILILIGEMRYFGETKPKLTERKVFVTADITSRTGMQNDSTGFPRTPEQVDHLMYVLQFSGPDVPSLFQIYKNETKGATLDVKLEAAMSIFGKIDYDKVDDMDLMEIVKINSLIKGTYCKNSTYNSTSQFTSTALYAEEPQPQQHLDQLPTTENSINVNIKTTKEAKIKISSKFGC